MQKLFDYQNFILEEIEKRPFYIRDCFKKITLDNRLSGVVGARGIGKTTFLLQCAKKWGAKKGKALYVSADNIYFLENRLFNLAERLYSESNVTLLCIDEIHKSPHWDQDLKNISDTFLNLKILFSGSSTIDIVRKKYDLSRRTTLYHLHGLSFREYLNFYHGQDIPVFALEDILSQHVEIAGSLKVDKILKHFQTYLRIGYYPFFSEFTQDLEKYRAIENAVQKTIYEDIGTLHALKTPTLLIMEKLFQYVLTSAPGELNASKLASHLGKDFQSVTDYLKWLQEAGLLRFLFPKSGSKAYLKNPTKMYPDNTNLIWTASGPRLEDRELGKIRETFVLCHLQNSGHKVWYPQKGDFGVNDRLFKVGGANKKQDQVGKEGVILSDGITIGFGNKIPLYLMGFLY